jgi:hypothetical protein
LRQRQKIQEVLRYGALSSIKGLELLKDEVLNDPQVRAALRDAGAL